MTINDEKTSVPADTGESAAVNSHPKGALTNAGWNGFFTLWSGIISLLLTPLLIHHLGVPQYGILLLIWSFTGMLGLANLGLGEATLRYVAYHYGDGNLPGVNRVFGSTLSFYTVICAIIAVSLFVSAPALAGFLKIPAGEQRLVGSLLRLSALVFSLGIFSQTIGAIPMALQRYDISSKIAMGQSIVRFIGYILLVVAKFGLLQIVLWDVLTLLGTISVQAAVVRKLAPGVRLLPSFSFRGLREIIGYGIFSFLTYGFYTVFRESGKLVLGRILGPSSVAYLGTPDNVTQRIHTLVASSTETLLPRFSANRDARVEKVLFINGTWAALAFSIVLLIPVIVLMPDFLSLWINPKFSSESAAVGQLLALSYIAQGGFAPPATFFRGIGKPWVVTVVLFLAGAVTLVSCVLLVPAHGVLGAGYAYLLGSTAHFLGLLFGWFYLFGASSIKGLMRSVALPILAAGIAFVLESGIRGRFTEVGWPGLFALGGLFAGMTGLFVLGADWILKGDSPSRQLLVRIGESDKLRRLFTCIPARRIR
jgi:O-antigen/teichoic acid export membrane protein